MTSPSAPPSPPRSALAAALGIAGALALALIATRFRLDRTLCSAWPSRATGFGAGAIYALAIGALTFAWWRTRSVAVALGVHALAILAAPFLSSDPLMYAAIGRALAGGASASTPLATALGEGHPFLVPLPDAWRAGTSAYGPAWNTLAALLGRIAGDDLALALRLHQGVALAALLAGAGIVGLFRPGAFALVMLCPLAVVEATIGAHNDAILIPFTALAVVMWLRGRALACLAFLAAAILWKASATIYLLPVLLAFAFAVLPARARRPALAALVAVGAAGVFAITLLHDTPLDAIARMVGRPDVPFDHCTRSLECLPRVVFRFALHWPTAAWATGIVFRVASVAWLGWCAIQAAEAHEARAPRAQSLSIVARGLFVYFLLLHGWAQSWYLLPLLPVVPFLVEDAWARPIRLYLVTAVVYYALVLPMSCLQDQVVIAVSDLIEASITVFPPVVIWLRSRRPT